jgi:HEPN domain-containing protein
LVSKGVDFPKTHDVDFLLSECRKVTSGELDCVDLKSLADFGVSVRYPDDFYVPDLSETTYYTEVAKDVKGIVERLMESE